MCEHESTILTIKPRCKMQISSPPPPVYDSPLTLYGHASHTFPQIYGIFAEIL